MFTSAARGTGGVALLTCPHGRQRKAAEQEKEEEAQEKDGEEAREDEMVEDGEGEAEAEANVRAVRRASMEKPNPPDVISSFHLALDACGVSKQWLKLEEEDSSGGWQCHASIPTIDLSTTASGRTKADAKARMPSRARSRHGTLMW